MTSIPMPVSYDTAMMTAKNATSISPEKLKNVTQAAKDFEAMYVSQMMSHMFEGVDVDPMFGGGHGEEMFRSMLVEEYGKKVAEGPGLGLSDQLQKVMIQMQENMKGE